MSRGGKMNNTSLLIKIYALLLVLLIIAANFPRSV